MHCNRLGLTKFDEVFIFDDDVVQNVVIYGGAEGKIKRERWTIRGFFFTSSTLR